MAIPATNSGVELQTTADAHRAARGLELCPSCNYSLNSLPAAHRCPECGLEYDEHTRVWRPKNWTRMLGFGALFFGSFYVLKFSGGIQTGPGSHRFWLSIGTLIFVGGAICYAVVGFRRKPCVAVTPRGLFVRLQLREGTLIPWSDIKSFKFGMSLLREGDKPLIVKTNRGERIDLTAISRGVGVAERIAHDIEEAKDHYQKTAAELPSPSAAATGFSHGQH